MEDTILSIRNQIHYSAFSAAFVKVQTNIPSHSLILISTSAPRRATLNNSLIVLVVSFAYVIDPSMPN
jgi:hypothetical protein